MTSRPSNRVVDVTVGSCNYHVQIEADEAEGGFVATVSGLPGCITEGQTLEETIENAVDAIKGWLDARDALRREGVDI